MKTKILVTMTLCTLFTATGPALAQGTAFTHQGRLFDGATAANGKYDLRFNLFDALSGGSLVAGPKTNSAVAVSNGLFTVTLDFGAGVFTGPARFLEIGARSNTVAVAFTVLAPRQELTPTPYAIFAEGANAAGISGTLPAGALSGIYGGVVTFNNPGNSFSGNGGGLTNVNALTLGGLGPNAFWKLLGNAGTTPGVNYLGTPDNQPVDFRVNNVRGFRIEPDTLYNSPNVIGGSAANFVVGAVGNFIGSGGQVGFASNSIISTLASFYNMNVIGGGWANTISNSYEGTIGGGYYNFVNNDHATVSGGEYNAATGLAATVPGGGNNLAAGSYSFAAGQNAQAMNSGSFVWADNSGGTFADTGPNQFLVRAGFVGINRATPVTGADVFAVRSATDPGNYGGMYLDTTGTNTLPFYGFAMNGSAIGWTSINGNDANKWFLYDTGNYLSYAPTTGFFGVNTYTPAQALDVQGEFAVVHGIGDEQAYMGGDGAGGDVQFGSLNPNIMNVAFYNASSNAYMNIFAADARIQGTTQIGSGAGTAEAPDKGLILRRVQSTTFALGSVVARTDMLTLERDGSSGGWRIVNVAFPGNTTIAFTGLTGAGATVTFVTSIPAAAAAGTNIVFTDVQNVVSLHGSFGNSFSPANMTEVSLTRYPTDWFWTGTLTSTFNQ